MSNASRLFPPCFPHAPKECEAVASPFFKCLSQFSVKASNDDVTAGIVGLEKCHKEMKHYLTCMEAYERKKTPKLLRVCVLSLCQHSDRLIHPSMHYYYY